MSKGLQVHKRAQAIVFTLLLALIATESAFASRAVTPAERAKETQALASPFGPLESALKQNFLYASLPTYREIYYGAYDLLDYMRTHLDPEPRSSLITHIDPYNRLKHFGAWRNTDPSSGCEDTRARVLIRDAQPGSIQYSPNHCTVTQGDWLDPYTGTEFKLANAVQIDHVVPLKHVYLSGGYAWHPRSRCFYANFLNDNYHLLAVSGHENMSKGDKSPDGYMPPDRSFQCHYLNIWMKVKLEWQLNVAPEELAAVERLEQDLQCPASETQVSADEVTQLQYDMINNVPQTCIDFENHFNSQGGDGTPDNGNDPTGGGENPANGPTNWM